MENNTERVVTGEGGKSELYKIVEIATLGAVKQLADKNTYAYGLGAGLLFGRKAGIKTIGAMAGAGAVYNVARYFTGEIKDWN